MSSLPSVENMYKAITERDETYLGVFFVAVKTTRIFCRPGCPARAPLLKNVEFFRTASEALHAGYRPCLRCRPMDAGIKPPDWVTGLMRQIDECPERRITDQDLRQLGVDPERARRTRCDRRGSPVLYHRNRSSGSSKLATFSSKHLIVLGLSKITLVKM